MPWYKCKTNVRVGKGRRCMKGDVVELPADVAKNSKNFEPVAGPSVPGSTVVGTQAPPVGHAVADAKKASDKPKTEANAPAKPDHK